MRKLLSANSHEIAIVSDAPEMPGGFFPNDKLKSKSLSFYSVDIRDKDALSELFCQLKADTCVHLAAKVSVEESIKHPDETLEINATGTQNVLEACTKSLTGNFILASSAAVYGDVQSLPIVESEELRPLSPYGDSKKIAEEYVASYTKEKKIHRSVILRIFNVYGSGQSSGGDVISKYIARLSNRRPPIIHGKGEYTRDFISVQDVASAIKLSIDVTEGLNPGNNNYDYPLVINVGTGIPTSMHELAKKMIRISGIELSPVYDKGTVDSKVILHSYADMTRATSILNFVPTKGIDEGLREMIMALTSAK